MKTLEKICMIGPSYPFRGGVAQYTTLLYHALKQRHEVTFFAFSRQYPQLLYPGKTDKDPSNLTIREDDVEYTLDSMNPISWWKTICRIRDISPDILIIPWWVSFWTPQFWYIAGRIHKLSSTKVLFICHNVVQHESGMLDRICTKLVLRNGDFFIVHSEEDLINLKRMLPYARVRKGLHPAYEIFNRHRITKSQALEKLGISGRMLLFFGAVRPYKGLKYLLEAMPAIYNATGAHLIAAGVFWRDKAKYVKQIQELDIENHVTLEDRYIPNEEVDLYFQAADIVVLPYITATQSGVVQIAYAFYKPVIATKVGGLPEVVDHGKTGFLVEPENSSAIAEAVSMFYESALEAEFKHNIIRKKEDFSWDRMVEAIAELTASDHIGDL